MKFSIIETKKKLEQLILHLESTIGMHSTDSATSIDRYITEKDSYIIDTACLLKNPDFAGYLIRLFRMASGSKLDKKVQDALVAIGTPVEDEMIGMLDGDHGSRAAMVLANIGSEKGFRAVTSRASMDESFYAPAIKASARVANDEAIDFLVKTLDENKPLGFPASLIKKAENEKRVVRTNLASKALRDITGKNFQKPDEWVEWRKKK